MDIVRNIGVVVFIGSLLFHIYRVAKDVDWGEKFVIVGLLIGSFLIIGPSMIEAGNRICPSCKTVYDARDKYCSECGTLLGSVCPECGAAWDTAYCGDCGTRMGPGTGE